MKTKFQTAMVLLAAIVATLLPATVEAEDFIAEGLKYTVNPDGVSVTLSGYGENMPAGELEIPDAVQKYK